MRLSVVIPTHGRAQGLRDLLNSLADQEFDLESVDVHVVANLAGDPAETVTREFQARFARLRYHVVGFKGVNRARNRGLDVARGDAALFLDDDCRLPHRYFFADLVQALSECPDAVALGGGYFTPVAATAAETAYNEISSIWLERRTEGEGRSVHLVGGNVCYRLAELRARGLRFNEDIAFGGAETDLHARAHLAGGRLVYRPELAIEHRARVGGWALLRKGFLQGIAAHIRWRDGLFVATRARPRGKFLLNRRARFWQARFDLAFRLGNAFARVEPDRAPSVARVTRFLVRQGWTGFLRGLREQVKNRVLSRRWRLGAVRMPVGLPLSRFYFLPLAKECPRECSYAATLGCRAIGDSFDAHLKRAKAFHFKEVLVPCNVYYLDDHREILKRISAEGLRPVILVNGDERAAVPLETLSDLSGHADFHLLLGPPSEYQDRVVEYLSQIGRAFSATYLHHDRRGGLRTARLAPALLAQRTHYIFPAIGDLWHPHPSGVEINRFLGRLARRRPGLSVRGPAGHWPVERGPRAQTEPFPNLEPSLVFGAEESAKPLFSVIIPTFDAGDHLVKVLNSLAEQSLSPTRFEVIVVDDGSADGTEALLRHHFQTTPPAFHFKYFYWPRPQSGEVFRAGLIRNLGVSRARGDFLCFLDSDILVPPDYLQDLRGAFGENDIIQARREMLTKEASEASRSFRRFANGDTYPDSDYWEAFKANESWSDLRKHWKYTCTYALSIRKSLFVRAGWFSPEFFTYGFEDVDLGYRCAKLGARFHLSQKAVYHLFPVRQAHNYHFDESSRMRALTLSSRVFYRQRLDAEIYEEFQSAYFQPLRGELKLLAGDLRWAAQRRFSTFWWRIHGPLFKPYYFTRFQVRKYMESRAEVSHAEP